MRIAMDAPRRLLAAKNSSNIGEFLEFTKILREGATLANTDSRRSLYSSAIRRLPPRLSCPGVASKKDDCRELLYKPCQ